MKIRLGYPTPDPHRVELKRMIRLRSLRMAFQPIYDLDRARPAGLEALCRPVGSSFVSASELFSAAERLRMLWPLEQVARTSAIGTARQWSGNERLFLNCSPQVVCDPRFLQAIEDSVESGTGFDRTRMVLEITERSDPRMRAILAGRVHDLKSLGFEVAIDDVGAGMSGLNRIMDLRPQWLKLDRELIRTIDTDPYRQSLVRALASFTLDNDIRMVAEGVERAAELQTMLSLGVRYAQGFHLGRPTDCLETPSSVFLNQSAPRVRAA
jgi:EAL domain-containing protein (putative c-di-GMP-specific phosphodiesterase class I)